ncbi:DUF805 domain-containing protein [Microvirga lenta]|uniref:DUF805 domain-containing protein n=1 Tax=Microvirga lenta TaxID=2881337 RepID=UPI001CFD531E|nr:DUF805 domain-containing protein [Microvirga lenta]MCB5174000.1 DUF805 domain-containing protein [Microvirga lenta]
MSAFALFFSFRGRINRARYWFAMLVLTGIVAVLGVSIGYLDDGRGWTDYAVLALVFLVVVYSGFAVSAKRLHDRDKSGWLLLYLLAPALILAPAEAMQNRLIVLAGTLFSWAVSIWFLIELGILPGSAGPNRFGEDPLARGFDSRLPSK